VNPLKIGIISDTHGSLTAWQTAYTRYFSQTDLIIHCGDILYHGPRNPLPEGYKPSELAAILNQVKQPVLFAKGNCDAEVDQMLIEAPIEAPYIHCYLNGLRILVHHGHLFTPETLPTGTARHLDLVISGHTHIPVIERHQGLTWINPGSPSLPKTEDNQPSIAILDQRHLEIINLNTGEVIKAADL